MTTHPRGAVRNAISHGFDAFDVRVGTLESEVQEVKTSIAGLHGKIDSSVGALAQEFRNALSGLSAQLTERSKTPWAVIFAGAAVAVSVIAGFGHQALSPMQADISLVKSELVPRVEHDYRAKVEDQRLERIERMIDIIEQRRYEETIRKYEGDKK